MIIDAILKFFTAPIISLLRAISVTVTIPTGVLAGLSSLLANLGWAFPVAAIMPIFFLKLGIRLVQFSFAIVVRIKSFIPTMGD